MINSEIMKSIMDHFKIAKTEEVKTGHTIYDIMSENVSNMDEARHETNIIQDTFDRHNLEMTLSKDGQITVRLIK